MPGEINPRRLCFGCGDLNPCGLKLDFRVEGNRATAEFEALRESTAWKR